MSRYDHPRFGKQDLLFRKASLQSNLRDQLFGLLFTGNVSDTYRLSRETTLRKFYQLPFGCLSSAWLFKQRQFSIQHGQNRPELQQSGPDAAQSAGSAPLDQVFHLPFIFDCAASRRRDSQTCCPAMVGHPCSLQAQYIHLISGPIQKQLQPIEDVATKNNFRALIIAHHLNCG